MQLKLTWRTKGMQDIDLLVFEEQKIAETMKILIDRGFLEEEAEDNIQYVKSMRTNNQVNTLLTYREANIYSGDILKLEDNHEDEI